MEEERRRPTIPRGLESTHREMLLLKEKDPEVYQELMRQKQLDQRHRRFIEASPVIIRLFGNVCGLIALLLLAVVAWHAFDLRDPDQGAAIICTGAASIVTVFVTGHVATRPGRRKRSDD